MVVPFRRAVKWRSAGTRSALTHIPLIGATFMKILVEAQQKAQQRAQLKAQLREKLKNSRLHSIVTAVGTCIICGMAIAYVLAKFV